MLSRVGCQLSRPYPREYKITHTCLAARANPGPIHRQAIRDRKMELPCCRVPPGRVSSLQRVCMLEPLCHP